VRSRLVWKNYTWYKGVPCYQQFSQGSPRGSYTTVLERWLPLYSDHYRQVPLHICCLSRIIINFLLGIHATCTTKVWSLMKDVRQELYLKPNNCHKKMADRGRGKSQGPNSMWSTYDWEHSMSEIWGKEKSAVLRLPLHFHLNRHWSKLIARWKDMDGQQAHTVVMATQQSYVHS